MNTPIVYIAGPISGQPNLNREAFDEADKRLKALGFITRNPHSFCSDIHSDDPSDPRFYRRGIQVLASECTDMVVLEGWQYSTGAALEKQVAILCQIQSFDNIEDLVAKYSNSND